MNVTIKDNRDARLACVRAKPNDGDYFRLCFFTDLHIGASTCEIDNIIKTRDYCLRHKIPVIIGGDVIENGCKSSPGASMYSQIMQPQKQVECAVDVLGPLADSGLIIGMHDGNHEERTYKSSGITAMSYFYSRYDIPKLGAEALVHIRTGSRDYCMVTMHGRAGGVTKNGVINMLRKVHTNYSVDAVVMGHVHQLWCDSFPTVKLQSSDRRLNPVAIRSDKIMATGGSYLSYNQSYGQARGWGMPEIGSLILKFNSTKNEIGFDKLRWR